MREKIGNIFNGAFYSSLASRLVVAAAVMSLIVLAGLVLILSEVYRSSTLSILDDEMDLTLTSLLRSVNADANGQLLLNEETLPVHEAYRTAFSGRYWVIAGLDVDSDTYTDELPFFPKSLYQGDIPWPEEFLPALMEAPGETIRTSGPGPIGQRLRMAAKVVTLSGRDNPVMLMAAFDRSSTDAGARRFTWILVSAMSALGSVILIAVWFGVRAVLRPLSRIRHDIEDIREGHQTKLEGNYPSEVLPLSQELNKLLDHNKGIVERAQTHVGNLAHALKTPLAVMMNEASGASNLDDVVRRQTGSMHASVQHYLKRARAAARAQAIGVRSEVGPVLEGLSRTLNKLFARQEIHVSVKLPKGLYFRGERQDLEEMVGNLMENACKWANSRVQVSAELTSDGFLLHVDDDGEGLEPEERVAALKRGVRLDEAAPGTGLGLSIVTELAEMHEGAFMLDDAPVLGGLRASLRLPRG